MPSIDFVVRPAARHPVYPIAVARGPAPEKSYIIDIAADRFRHEPSLDPDRPRCFRTREFARIDSPERLRAFRARWIDRLALALFAIHGFEPNLWNEDARAVLDLGAY
jgi:hypothetical protein